MSILQRLFGTMPVQVKESVAAKLHMVGPTEVSWSNRDYSAFAKEGYQQNVIVYQGINKIAEAIASVEWETWRGDTQLNEHPLLVLLQQPNPQQSLQEFMTAYVGFLMISGNSYVEKVTVNSEPREMYVQRADRMKVKKSATGLAGGYTYTVGGRSVNWDVDQATGASDIMHTKLFNPLDEWYGQSPLEAGAFGVDQHNLAMAWVQALLQNSARPSGAIVMKNEESLTDDQFDRLKAEVETNYSGADNAGRPMLLDGGMDWKPMGLSPSDMGVNDTKNGAARDISLALGVPPMLMGIKGDNTYANYAEARMSFWEDTILPLIAHIAGDFNAFFGAHYDGVEIRPNLDKIPAIVEKRQRLWTMADTSNDLTINERRELKGYDPIDGGDQILITGAMIPLTEASLTADDLNEQPKLGDTMGEAVSDQQVITPSPTENVQSQALNGAQMSSMQQVLQAVADGVLPAESAMWLLMISIPSLTQDAASQLVKPAEGFVQTVQADMKTPTADEEKQLLRLVYGK
jgi:HK97 family phage portal protein